jgi:RNA-directed DNA polymerase
VRDRLTLRVICNILKSAFPQANTPPPHAYIKDCAAAMRAAREHSSFLRMDIKDFYPSIRHDLLKECLATGNLPEWLIKLVLDAVSTPTGSTRDRCNVGVPQGLSISNALAAIYMTQFDKIMESDYFFRRYVDDILIIAPTERIKKIYLQACGSLDKFGLTSHKMDTPGKTEQLHVPTGVQFLGYVLKPDLISVRQSSFGKMFNSLYRVLTNIKYQGKLTPRDKFRINLKITGCYVNNTRRGWLMFFSQTEDTRQLKHLDNFINQALSRLKVDRELNSIKRYMKSYYEIRYNAEQTAYIPNFDKMSQDERIELIAVLSEKSVEEISTRSADFIEREFSRLISREVNDLEKDVLSPFS